ncbi:hypothetical protein [Embleya hyalina]|uniref:Uncharacterized protein n=1 Tax=Embleya hyalina TaxID=516124 RepID=A0A401YDE2_9ACTN|nr:hypothetical protein [Embleya hyalina]GCD92596.1 hypothetical protein EHYA_00235 [Embleya hyalina]
MQPLAEDEIELVLVMVDAAAAVVAPEDREDLFDDFAEDMRESGLVPGAESVDVDESDAALVDGHVFLGIGLTVLGQIAYRVLAVATDIAINRGLRDAVGYARGLFASADGDAEPDGAGTPGTPGAPAAPGRDAAGDPPVTRAVPTVGEIAALVLAAEGNTLPPQVDPAAIEEIVREQLRALAEAEPRGPGDSAPA